MWNTIDVKMNGPADRALTRNPYQRPPPSQASVLPRSRTPLLILLIGELVVKLVASTQSSTTLSRTFLILLLDAQ